MQPTSPVGWWWGTNRPGGTFYAGRAHVVQPDQPMAGLCGLPVSDVWELRPPSPERLCPDCCVLAMTASYPPFPPTPAPPLPRRAASPGAPLLVPAVSAEQTAVMPVVGADDAP
ncbi:hypothetical protein GTS_35660 [Gandjariella thermophila]|uniref:Uncharacterized protein n=1 Tax=Gandjariella thermophila TaxID=1931992 RepID=A0A4D4JDH2_9PSEU|nr:hypothetical protein GTS_35660 [Gandjariella thermophila]